jgi:UDP-glucose 4-epimerase
MKVLVTGGAGYIGSVLVAKLIESGFEVNVLDDLSTGHQESIHANATFFKGSILNLTELREAMNGCGIVFHFAAKTLVEESVKKPDLYHAVNVVGTQNVLYEMIRIKSSKIIFASTCAVYKDQERPINESDLLGPSSPYGESKLSADQLIKDYCKSHSIGAFSFRFFNVAGSYFSNEMGWLEEKHSPETHLIPNLLVSSKEKSFKLFGAEWDTQDGTCVRDFVHVVDLVLICIQSINKIKDGVHEVFNLGTSTGISVKEVVEEFEKLSSKKLNVEIFAPRKGDSKMLVADPSKAEELLEWKPSHDLTQIIKSILKVVD